MVATATKYDRVWETQNPFPKAMNAILRHAEKEYPKESCGVIIDGVYVRCKNMSETPEINFEIDKLFYAKNEKKIQGIVHSHPEGPDAPTKEDMASQIRTNKPWCIVTAFKHFDEIKKVWFAKADTWFWWGDMLETLPVIGRRFRCGVTDCYETVRSWYKLERGIQLPPLPRDIEWWTTGQDLLLEHFKNMGFKALPEFDMEKLEVGDGLLGKVLSTDRVNHCGVYVGNSQILHHLWDRLSRQELIGPWTRHITHHLKFVGLPGTVKKKKKK